MKSCSLFWILERDVGCKGFGFNKICNVVINFSGRREKDEVNIRGGQEDTRVPREFLLQGCRRYNYSTSIFMIAGLPKNKAKDHCALTN